MNKAAVIIFACLIATPEKKIVGKNYYTQWGADKAEKSLLGAREDNKTISDLTLLQKFFIYCNNNFFFVPGVSKSSLFGSSFPSFFLSYLFQIESLKAIKSCFWKSSSK